MSACTPDINTAIASYSAFQIWTTGMETKLNNRDITGASTILSAVNCLTENISNINTLSTSDAEMQMKNVQLQQQIDQEKKNVEIAQQRLNTVKAPVTSFYESWFPIERPLKPSSVPILLFLTTAMGFMAFGYLLQIMNVYIFVQGKGVAAYVAMFLIAAVIITAFTLYIVYS
jgi:hypothetical protein